MRLYRIDSFRMMSAFLVILGHVLFFGGLVFDDPFLRAFRIAACTGGRFIIPLFAITSGVFVGRKIAEQPSKSYALAFKYTWRLLAAYLFWWIVYALEQPSSFQTQFQAAPWLLIFQGTRIHLWFFVSLVMSIWLFALWPFDKKGYSFLVFGALLFGIGWLAGPYKLSPIGFDLHFPVQLSPAFTTLFFAIGAKYDAELSKMNPKSAFALTVLGYGLFLGEAFALKSLWNLPMYTHDYLLGTIPFGIGVTGLAMGMPATSFDRAVAKLAPYMLGIYASHMLFIDLFRPLASWIYPELWLLIAPVIVAASSLLLSILARKTMLKYVFA